MSVDSKALPADLAKEIEVYKNQFWVPTETLNKIIEYFISELDRGNADGTDPTGIPMNAAWVLDYPDGSETGDYLAIDLGGTNLRVVLVHLLGNHKFTTEQSKYHIPTKMRTTQHREELFGFIAECLEDFLKQQHPEGIPTGKLFPLGFTFSYPASQNSITEGVLQRWTKGFDIPNVEGHDVVPLLMEQVEKKGLPIKIDALINDTSGTLVASRYTDELTEMGCIFGTGVNGAYYDRIKNIPKLQGKLEADIAPDSPMLINCEYGSFDNAHKVLPRTKFDIQIDNESPRPGQQAFEKMTSGYYLGELIRLIMLETYEKGLIFKSYTKSCEQIKNLQTPYFLDTSFLSIIEADDTADLSVTSNEFSSKLFIDTTFEERLFARKLSQFIGTRAARLSICGISAVCKKMDHKVAHIAADGSVFLKYPYFPERAAQGLSDVFGWEGIDMKDHPIQIKHAEDGSGVGAAIIAALSHARKEKGLSLGVKL
ncbi:hypothetical protein OGAPHI_005709 [Ogataea philodendri]|uniref:Phosphotransferase n=1 Tax=Ogataea philodendri TaxID=1378263 RepID=A0A9P8P092_9ASCO|nr:uncharacterized protein OGAPHI_005709 [Ogataea philodendri]KAH3662457.1 hypothetical protein OGAPHI_005709 [Ogataea philodendri]